VHLYQGDWRLTCDPQIIEAAVTAYSSAPAGYAIDFGVTATGETLMIEVNDGYALGNYGLPPIYYTQLLSARWSELTDTEDYGITRSEVFNS
jgi:ATP-grasp domain, R2K clade family 2